MPSVFGIPLIGFIQMVLGTGIIVFLLIKFLTRPKKNKKDEYIINDVHIIVGNGDEASHQYVYIKGGKIEEISDIPIEKKNVQIIDGTGKTLMPGLIDSHIHIQGGFNCRNEEESDAFLNEKMPPYKAVKRVKLRDVEFQKNTSRKITRFSIDKTID